MALFVLGDTSFVSSRLLVVGPGIAVAGFAVAWLIVDFGTAIQVRTPHRLQGRVAGAADTLGHRRRSLSRSARDS
jgi:hypothetical protein